MGPIMIVDRTIERRILYKFTSVLSRDVLKIMLEASILSIELPSEMKIIPHLGTGTMKAQYLGHLGHTDAVSLEKSYIP